MKKSLLLIWFISAPVVCCLAQHPDALPLPSAKFSTGDNAGWSKPGFDDSGWKDIKTGEVWQAQGFPDYHGYAWYRIHVRIPSSLKTNGQWRDSLRIFLAHVNDVDQTWLNGIKIGKTGSFPDDTEGYISKWPAIREYHIAVTNPAIKWDEENVIVIRDYDGGGTGGIFMGNPYLDMLERTDGITLTISNEKMKYLSTEKTEVPVLLQNSFNSVVEGVFTCRIYNAASQKEILNKKSAVRLNPFTVKEIVLNMPSGQGIECSFVFTESATGLSVSGNQKIPYILTPAPAASPHINSAKVFGVHPGSPFLFKIAATGKKPLSYRIPDLPKGLVMDKETGVIQGVLSEKGEYPVHVVVANDRGQAHQKLLIKVGDVLALTPAMGWNSWNCWGLSVSEDKVRSSAKALIDKGLADHGWTYINIDDGWQEPKRRSDSTLMPNDKFSGMKALGDWLHEKGLKFGIYSSPGPRTCGGYLGSYLNEQKDAGTYASWGIDYLKYDWCSYDGVVGSDTALVSYIKPYRVMQKALEGGKRDIVYNLCQYGMKDVWKWGSTVDGQSWRTTEDIEDTWESLCRIGFQQAALYPYAKPGNWNDPDMMIVGQVGWGENLHPSRLTPDEQYTHVSLWSLLAAPLLIGCDISKLDEFTLNLLTNDEVLAIDQDVLGRQAQQVIRNDKYQVWIKELEDGSNVVGIFNMDTAYRKIELNFKNLHLQERLTIRDVWRQKDLGVFNSAYHTDVPPHGVKLLSVKGNGIYTN
ncbi:putative Ig domain-containing protein [Flavitalea flava]